MKKMIVIAILLAASRAFADLGGVALSTGFSFQPQLDTPQKIGFSGVLGFMPEETGDVFEWNFGFSLHAYTDEKQFSQTELWSDFMLFFWERSHFRVFGQVGVKMRIEWASESHGMVLGGGFEIPFGPLFFRNALVLNLLPDKESIQLVTCVGIHIRGDP